MNPHLKLRSKLLKNRSFAPTFLCAGLLVGLAGCEGLFQLLDQFQNPPANNLQNLQVTVEVRFIQLEDRFFEQIGVDFDLELPVENDNRSFGNATGPQDDVVTKGMYVGGFSNSDYFVPAAATRGFLPRLIEVNNVDRTELVAFPNFVGIPQEATEVDNLDQPLNRDLNLSQLILPADATPPNLFSLQAALLSDAEVQAVLRGLAAADDRSILSAPRVTLANRQRAAVTIASEPAFLNAADEDFANAVRQFDNGATQIDVGVTLDVTPVVTDSGFVRLDIAPGTQSAQFFYSLPIAVGGITTMIQVPVIKPVDIRTTVSVPDGGTVLLGGMKLGEMDDATDGVPIFNRVPLVSRLFRNTATIDDERTLLIMVTPRIIIQEEEE